MARIDNELKGWQQAARTARDVARMRSDAQRGGDDPGLEGGVFAARVSLDRGSGYYQMTVLDVDGDDLDTIDAVRCAQGDVLSVGDVVTVASTPAGFLVLAGGAGGSTIGVHGHPGLYGASSPGGLEED